MINSTGPLGNTGSPSTFEDKQVFRAMFEKTATQLTADEIDSLIQSIGE